MLLCSTKFSGFSSLSTN